MEKENSGYVYAYGWNRFNMRVIGAWPENNENFIVKNRGWLYSIVILVIICLPMTASLAFLGGDLKQLIDCLIIDVTTTISVYKIALFRLRREVIVVMLTAMAKDWSITRTNDERKAMLEKAKYARIISVMSVVLAMSVLITYSNFRAWSARYERQLITNETRLAIGFLYPAYFPYDTKDQRGFLITWFCQFFVTIFSMTGYSGPDSLMAMMILHLCGQFATVRISIANIVDDECIDDPSVYWKRLASIIERHEELNRRGELLEGSFNVMLLIEMVLCTIIFCFQGFVIFTTLIAALTDDEDFPFLQMVFLVIQLFYTILHLFMYCWAGDLLVVESTALSYAPFESDWFRLKPAQAKALMMLTHRSRIPVRITAGKFVNFSLELFTSIMKTSMGYLSVLLAVQDD